MAGAMMGPDAISGPRRDLADPQASSQAPVDRRRAIPWRHRGSRQLSPRHPTRRMRNPPERKPPSRLQPMRAMPQRLGRDLLLAGAASGTLNRPVAGLERAAAEALADCALRVHRGGGSDLRERDSRHLPCDRFHGGKS